MACEMMRYSHVIRIELRCIYCEGAISTTSKEYLMQIRFMGQEIRAQEKLVASRTRTRKKIIGEIESVEDPRYRVLLYDRYVNLLSWHQIAKRMGYSEDHVRHDLHSNALQEFNKKRGH